MLRILMNSCREESKCPIYIKAEDNELENIYNHFQEKMKSIKDEIDQNQKLPHFYLKNEYANYAYICYQIEEYLKINNISYTTDENVLPNKISINIVNKKAK